MDFLAYLGSGLANPLARDRLSRHFPSGAGSAVRGRVLTVVGDLENDSIHHALLESRANGVERNVP